MKPSEQVIAALDYMRKHGWVQENYGLHGGPRCIAGALSSCHVEPRADTAVDEAIRELFPGALTFGPWNDAPDRTFEDVELVMKHAAYDLESRDL